STSWKQVSGIFTTGPGTKLLIFRVQRVPARSPIRGKLWIDDIRLVRTNYEGSSPMTSPVLSSPSTEPAVMRQPYRSLLDPITFYGAFGLLLFGPVAFGATEPWSIFLLEAGSALLFLMWIIRQAQAGAVMVSSSPLFAPMLSFMALVGLQ